MGSYNVPRNVKGEERFLFIFTGKGIITTMIGGAIGWVLFYPILSAFNLKIAGIIATLIFALIGFAIGTFKIPDTNSFEITRKTGGENIDDIILRYIKFKMKKKKLYVYTKEENTNG